MSSFLLINPPVCDFAAYDLWAKPLGLLYIASALKKAGAEVSLLDYLDRLHPALEGLPVSDVYGCGRYHALEIPKPNILKNIPRKYKRYGLPRVSAEKLLSSMPPPDAVLVTSVMSYWYPGVIEAIKSVKESFPNAPVILGGTYATLCPDHAAATDADYVITGSSIVPLFGLLKSLNLLSKDAKAPEKFDEFPPPAYELYPKLEYAAIRSTMGCPFVCTYCASNLLSGEVFEKKIPEAIAGELLELHSRGVNNIAFYDDALFVDADKHIIPILKGLTGPGGAKLNLHSPNGLHARFITPELAGVMKKARFIMPRLSFETHDSAKQEQTGGKVTSADFEHACRILREAGYGIGEYCAYIMAGMPGQSFEEVEEAARFAHSCGSKVLLVEYSPIPGTADWQKINHILPSSDPLWHNNSLFPLHPLSSWPFWNYLKNYARELNNNR